MKKTVFYSALGGVLEFYDFIIFAIFASAITESFFPSENHIAGFLLTFSIFAAGYIARPLGGIIFGHFGDKYGRKKTFTYSIIIMAISTLLIAIVPPYATIGILAPIILTFLRILQGISIGGEIPGAITFISETTLKNKTLACSVVFFGLVLGIIIGEIVHEIIVAVLSPQDVINYGWRIAFLIGGIFGILGFYLRKKLVETPLFAEMERVKVEIPIVKLFRDHSLAIFSGWAQMGLISAGIMVLFLIMPAYSKIIDLAGESVFLINTVVLFFVMLLSMSFGYLGDRVNKKYLLILSLFVAIVFSVLVFSKLISGNLSLFIYFIFCLLSFGIAVAIVPAVLAESFPTDVRYTGIAVVYNISFATTGGLAPVIVFSLISTTNNTLMPAFYFIAVSIIGFLGVVLYPKNKM